ncbi:LLM class flavin-dependent oxidoreductase [Streptomyces sp. NPDC094034]|uniref:LLM class flavin-dependent oxidoreductase n=1 Tax=Streptomyces sp. NPDC094034 TaxID=3155309 RepID=UPI0033207A53
MPIVGVGLARELPTAFVVPAARAVEAAGLSDLWVVEGPYFPGAMSTASAALTATEHINVGLGVVSAVSRNPVITAMEIATLAGLAPGRVIGGIGHGNQSWMEDIGERRASPLTTLAEVLDAVRGLLRGDELAVEGQDVTLRKARLEQLPNPVPPVFTGVSGPKSIVLAGQHADGLVMAGRPGPTYLKQVRESAAASDDFEIVAFVSASLDTDRDRVREQMAPGIASSVTNRQVSMLALPFYDELAARVAERGAEAVLKAPDEWWLEFGAIGTPDDALAHVEALARAGVDRAIFYFMPDQSLWESQVELVGREVLPHITA